MTLRDAKKLKPGALVRRAWNPDCKATAIVLHTEYIEGWHRAKLLGGKKKERFDVTVRWIGQPPVVWDSAGYMKKNVMEQTHQNWELMVVQHV